MPGFTWSAAAQPPWPVRRFTRRPASAVEVLARRAWTSLDSGNAVSPYIRAVVAGAMSWSGV